MPRGLKSRSGVFDEEYFSSDAYADYQNTVLSYVGAVGRKMASRVKNCLRPRILDVGCAQGYLIGWLKENFGFEVAGLEVSDYAISRAEKSVRSLIKKGDILSGKNFKPDSFDIVFCQDVCEYLRREDIAAAVAAER